MIGKMYLHLAVVCLIVIGCSPISTVPPRATITSTPFPTKTSTPVPAETLTALPMETQTPFPTLEPEEAEEVIKDLLWNNSDCLAPCFIGIVPNQTSLEEAHDLFAHLGRELHHTNTEESKEFYEATYPFDSGLAIDLVITVQSEIVKDFRIGLTLPQDQSLEARREWSTYSAETLINHYGLPSKVNFFVGRGPTPSYVIDMYFDTSDLIIEYYSYDIGTKLQVCPLQDQMESIRIWMGKEPQNPPLETVPLEQATFMTMEEFSNLIIGDPNKACFNLRAEAFP